MQVGPRLMSIAQFERQIATTYVKWSHLDSHLAHNCRPGCRLKGEDCVSLGTVGLDYEDLCPSR